MSWVCVYMYVRLWFRSSVVAAVWGQRKSPMVFGQNYLCFLNTANHIPLLLPLPCARSRFHCQPLVNLRTTCPLDKIYPSFKKATLLAFFTVWTRSRKHCYVGLRLQLYHIYLPLDNLFEQAHVAHTHTHTPRCAQTGPRLPFDLVVYNF